MDRDKPVAGKRLPQRPGIWMTKRLGPIDKVTGLSYFQRRSAIENCYLVSYLKRRIYIMRYENNPLALLRQFPQVIERFLYYFGMEPRRRLISYQ